MSTQCKLQFVYPIPPPTLSNFDTHPQGKGKAKNNIRQRRERKQQKPTKKISCTQCTKYTTMDKNIFRTYKFTSQ